MLAAAMLLGCVVSRSIGLPGATDDMGNWLDALGLASLFIDGVVVLLGVSAFTEHLPVRRQAGKRSVDDVRGLPGARAVRAP
ncbi:hypothetical protein GCM10011579_096770 [Streptomyces albiflavescens]|uniref:Uncharacterized protein n=1 Tax=Streptomyces albiflavescens TaxID=1623582 RepID=A0A917YH67_9ACTN|nr:hypothetical protein GCM10011579_096770 [Streptomyces albiflavescens]